MAAPTERLDGVVAASARWTAIEHHHETTSTSDVALARAREGAPPGLVVVADHQTKGRGRHGRTWEDRPGRSLLASEVVLPPAHALSLVPLVVGVGIAEALERHGARAVLKWPNDVLIDVPEGGEPHKTAGVLVEHHEVEGHGLLIVGTGVNVDWHGTDRPVDAAWTSVAEAVGHPVDRWELLADLLECLDPRLDELSADPAKARDRYRERCATIGRDVEVVTPEATVAGRAVDVDDDGALVLEGPDGHRARITAGDVVHVAAA